MPEFVKAVDFGNAPTVSVDGLVRVVRVSENKVRLTYCETHNGEHRVVLHVDWDICKWARTADKIAATKEAVLAQQPANDLEPVETPAPMH